MNGHFDVVDVLVSYANILLCESECGLTALMLGICIIKICFINQYKLKILICLISKYL